MNWENISSSSISHPFFSHGSLLTLLFPCGPPCPSSIMDKAMEQCLFWDQLDSICNIVHIAFLWLPWHIPWSPTIYSSTFPVEKSFKLLIIEIENLLFSPISKNLIQSGVIRCGFQLNWVDVERQISYLNIYFNVSLYNHRQCVCMCTRMHSYNCICLSCKYLHFLPL